VKPLSSKEIARLFKAPRSTDAADHETVSDKKSSRLHED
jgi:hypothetical protein